jgi:hypothetical protein
LAALALKPRPDLTRGRSITDAFRHFGEQSGRGASTVC